MREKEKSNHPNRIVAQKIILFLTKMIITNKIKKYNKEVNYDRRRKESNSRPI